MAGSRTSSRRKSAVAPDAEHAAGRSESPPAMPPASRPPGTRSARSASRNKAAARVAANVGGPRTDGSAPAATLEAAVPAVEAPPSSAVAPPAHASKPLTPVHAPDGPVVEPSASTIPELFQRQVKERGPAHAMHFKAGGVWKPINWEQYGAAVWRIAGFLRRQGVRAGDRIAILSYIRPA